MYCILKIFYITTEQLQRFIYTQYHHHFSYTLLTTLTITTRMQLTDWTAKDWFHLIVLHFTKLNGNLFCRQSVALADLSSLIWSCHTRVWLFSISSNEETMYVFGIISFIWFLTGYIVSCRNNYIVYFFFIMYLFVINEYLAFESLREHIMRCQYNFIIFKLTGKYYMLLI